MNLWRRVASPWPWLLACNQPYASAVIGLDYQVGALKPGYRADVVLLDEGLQVVATVVRGADCVST